MEIRSDIDYYFNYLRSHLNSIDTLNAGEHSILYKRLVYMAFIDMISSFVYPNNKNRVVKTLKRFSNWNDGEKISLPHLARALIKNPDPSYEKLRKYVNEQFVNWAPGEVVRLDRDLNFDEVRKRCPQKNGKEDIDEKIEIEKLTHYRLFYEYRNSLVHELSTPTSQHQMQDIEFPYYMHWTVENFSGDPKEEHWQLNYPVNFIENIAKVLFENVYKYYKEYKLNPYDRVESGYYWLKFLNK